MSVPYLGKIYMYNGVEITMRHRYTRIVTATRYARSSYMESE